MFTDRRIRTSLVAIAADLLLTAFKASLAWLTGSAALMADAYHSGTDLVVSLVLLGSLVVRFFQDKSLLEGTGEQDTKRVLNARRLESAMAVVVALIILYVPYEIVRELGSRTPETVSHLWIGIIGTLIIIGLVHFMARLKTYVGRETDSPALEADGYHSKIDLFSSIAVLLSLIGLMVGVYLDEIVAVIIAVLIGIAGLELLISGLRSLARGDDLDPVSLFESVGNGLARIPLAGMAMTGLSNGGRVCARAWQRARWAVAVLVIGAYLATGLHQVSLGHTGLERRFAAIAADNLEPGLHYALPWPFGSINDIPNRVVYSTTVGSRFTDSAVSAAQPGSRLWRETTGTRVHEDDTAYLATGDENLIDLEFSLQYRLAEPVASYRLFGDVEAVVRRYLEMALWQQAAQHSFNQLLDTSHSAFSSRVAAQVESELQQVGLPITIVDAQVQSLQPPALVVNVYRDRLNAAQEKEQRQNRAQAQRIHDLLMANAQRVTLEADVESEAIERVLMAEGETERFLKLAETFSEHGAAVAFNQHLQTLVNNMQERRLLITDPAIESHDLRVWGQQNISGFTSGGQKR